MSCNKCGCNTNPCCCPSIPYQLPGPPGPMGPPGIQGNPGPQGATGPAGPSSLIFELIATVTETDVNALAGVPQGFALAQVLFNNRLPLAMYIKTTEVFDVDLFQLDAAYLNQSNSISSFNTFTLIIPTLNNISIGGFVNSIDMENPLTDHIEFHLLSRNPGKPGNFIGGNTTGNIEIYALWQPI